MTLAYNYAIQCTYSRTTEFKTDGNWKTVDYNGKICSDPCPLDNGVFTAPKNGIYQFFFQGFKVSKYVILENVIALCF